MTSVIRIQEWARQQARKYSHGEDRPLSGYLQLMGVYATGTVAASLLARVLGRPAPRGLSPWDVAQLTIGTHKLARLLAKDPVTSPLRAPFTRYEGTTGPSELAEEVRGNGFRHSAGELITCPMCTAQWVATGFTLGLVLAPKLTRLVLATLTAVAGADFLQHAYVALQQQTE
jgi:hypothetical protein